MNAKKAISAAVAAAFVLAVMAAPAAQAQVPQKKDEKAAAPQAKIYIPKEIKDAMLAGMAARQAKPDVPFQIFRTTLLPAQNAYWIYFFLRMKNSDLGFGPPAISPVAEAAAAAPQAKLQAKINVFMSFHKLENGAPTTLVKEVYVPAVVEADAAGFDPEKEEWYSVGYPLPVGSYLLSLSVASADLKKFGIQYQEFSLPDPKSFTAGLDTTPIFFAKNINQVQAPEMRSELHKGFFSWSVLQITPNMDNVFAVGDTLDVFFYIFGTQPKDGGKFDIEIDFEVNEGDKPAIRYAPGNFESPLISLPLTMKQTLQIKKGDEVRTETRDLPAGSYTFVIKMTDKVSGLKGEKKLDFTVK